MTADDFERTATIKDDALERSAEISTIKGFNFRGGFTERVRSDNFVRAFVNKSTGATTFQLYQVVIYTGERRNFRMVNFQAGGELVSAEVTVITSDTVSCDMLCVYEDHLGFELPEALVRDLTNAHNSGATAPWRFKFKAQSGEDWQDDMSPAEVAGLTRRVETYLAALGKQ